MYAVVPVFSSKTFSLKTIPAALHRCCRNGILCAMNDIVYSMVSIVFDGSTASGMYAMESVDLESLPEFPSGSFAVSAEEIPPSREDDSLFVPQPASELLSVPPSGSPGNRHAGGRLVFDRHIMLSCPGDILSDHDSHASGYDNKKKQEGPLQDPA